MCLERREISTKGLSCRRLHTHYFLLHTCSHVIIHFLLNHSLTRTIACSMTRSISSASRRATARAIASTSTSTSTSTVWGLALAVALQLLAVTLHCVCAQHDGSATLFLHSALQHSHTHSHTHPQHSSTSTVTAVVSYLLQEWPTPFDPAAVKLVLSFVAFELFLMRYAPGARCEAPVSKRGHASHLPVYRANCLASYVISVGLLAYLLWHDDYYMISELVYSKFGCILSTINFCSVIMSALLLWKCVCNPSAGDAASCDNMLLDFIFGAQFYPRVWNMDVKQFMSCHFGLIGWQLFIVSLAYQQIKSLGWLSSSMMVSVVLQSVHIFNVVLWEAKMLCSTEFQQARVGYFHCWDSLVRVTTLPALVTLVLVKQKALLTPFSSAILLTAGLYCVWCRHELDRYQTSRDWCNF
jgi:hypothetical protein